jgi:hypothetical protein
MTAVAKAAAAKVKAAAAAEARAAVMTEPRPTRPSGVTRPPGPSRPAGPAAPRPVAARPSRRKRFVLTLAAAAAGFVIVFQFLALQLKSGNDPAIGAALQASSGVSASTHAGASPVVTRSSGGVQSVPVSSTATAPTPTATTAHGHGHGKRPIKTGASGATSAPRAEHDDLG